ncbi:receptor like protein 50 [Artemisia annua]|uniref:Receptor like protein 50 n=1 Tax=Artemisia annua TaxID=35608 RepID=A0A2U1NTC8_ARTAN|nr:receptor like protein 50 [Artemisia annua]
MLCRDDERQALLQFKHGLIDEANRLASWVGKESDCCRWAGIGCDNSTGHVHRIHLPGSSYFYANSVKEYKEALKKQLRGDLSPSILNLLQLRHLDLSCNDFGGIQVPSFMGSFQNLRYLNLSHSGFGGTIPPQLGNLTELRILCLGSFYTDTDEPESTSVMNLQWLSRLRMLHHLDMSSVDLSKAIDWFQVINTLPSLVELHLSNSQLQHIHPHVSSLNLTSLSLLDLSRNNFSNSFVPPWIFSQTGLVSLDLTFCGFPGPVSTSYNSFHNLTSLKFLHVSGNAFMSSSLVLEGLSRVGSNLISLDIGACGVSSSVLNSLHNLTSLFSLDLSDNPLTTTIPKSLGNLCNLRHLDLADTYFSNTSLTSILESFFECKSPSLESLSLESSQLSCHLPHQLGQLRNLVLLQLGNNHIAGVIPESIARLSLLRYLNLDENFISGPIPNSIGELSSLELLDLSHNRLNGSLPDSLGQLSKLNSLDISYNLLRGIITEVHFVNLTGLKYLKGLGNSLTLRPRLANWIPSFQLQFLYLSSWELGPEFPLWLQLQKDLELLEIANTSISSTVPEAFWRSFSDLQYLDMSQNQIQGKLFHIPASLQILDLSRNKLSGNIPRCFNNFSVLSKKETPAVDQFGFLQFDNTDIMGSDTLVTKGQEYTYSTTLGLVMNLDLSSNKFSGSIPSELMALKALQSLNLSINLLTGRIPEKIGDFKLIESFDVSLNQLSRELPVSLSSLTFLCSFNVSFNNLTGRIPSSTQLQGFNQSSFIGNKLCGVPLTERCGEVASSTDQEERDGSHRVDWGLIISTLCGFAVGFWIAVAPLMVGRIRQIAPFRFVSNLTYMLYDLIH